MWSIVQYLNVNLNMTVLIAYKPVTNYLGVSL